MGVSAVESVVSCGARGRIMYARPTGREWGEGRRVSVEGKEVAMSNEFPCEMEFLTSDIKLAAVEIVTVAEKKTQT